MLPVGFLRQLISMYGNSMQNLMPSYLDATMTNFRERQSEIREAFDKGMQNNPLTAIHETNMAMMRAAAETFIPGVTKKKADPDDSGEATDEIAALREQMAAMQKKLDELGK